MQDGEAEVEEWEGMGEVRVYLGTSVLGQERPWTPPSLTRHLDG